MKTGKKVLTVMLACAMVTSTAFVTYSVADKAVVSVSAAETTSDGWEYTVNSDGTATITGYSKKSGDLIIPNTVDGKTVTEIGDYAFERKTGYQSVTIPGTVKTIGFCAFIDCTGLRSINIQSGVETIENSAFNGCTALKNIILPDSIERLGTSSLLGSGVFGNCSSLETVTLGKSLKEIGGYAFNECTSLKNIKLPQSVESIGRSCFKNCSSLKNIVIPNNVKEIKDYTFGGCTNLLSVILSENLETIGKESFNKCSSLTNIKIPDTVISIGSSAFSGCTSLENVKFGNSVETIGNSAFSNTKVKNIILPASLKELLGASVWVGIFGDCKELKTVVFQSSENTDFTNIPSNMFKGCINLTDVNILATVTTIEDEAFKNCTSLESIILPNSVTIIESGAFCDCTSLKKIVIPESVTEIESDGWSSVFSRHSDELTIYGYKGTRAESYASENNIKFVALDGHAHENETHVIEATCEDGGMKITRCKICGHLENAEYIAPKGHKSLTVTKQATCTEDGERTGTCTDCGKTVTEIIPATGHNWSEWTIDPDNAKQEVRTCANCGEKEYRELTTDSTDPTSTGTTPNPAPTPTPTPTPNGKTVDTGAEMPLLAVLTLAASSVSVALLKKRRKNNRY